MEDTGTTENLGKENVLITRAEVLELLPKKMTDEEQMQASRDARDIAHSHQQFAEQRSEDMSGEFIRLEVQIATFLFAFSGIFVGSFTNGSTLDIFWAKLAFAFAVAFLILSLVMGLLQLKCVEKFWDGFLNQRFLRYAKWREATRRETSFDQALAYEKGTSLDRGNIVFTPRWPWILQTIFLGLAVAVLFVLFLSFLFGASSAVQTAAATIKQVTP